MEVERLREPPVETSRISRRNNHDKHLPCQPWRTARAELYRLPLNLICIPRAGVCVHVDVRVRVCWV